jgi:hypothetical protein
VPSPPVPPASLSPPSVVPGALIALVAAGLALPLTMAISLKLGGAGHAGGTVAKPPALAQ